MARLFDGSLKMALAICLAGSTLLVAPPRVRESIQAAIRDASRPGLLVVVQIIDNSKLAVAALQAAWLTQDRVAMLESQVQAAELRERHWQLAAAELRNQLSRKTSDQQAPSAETVPPLITAEFLSARILAGDTAALWREQKILGIGRNQGLVESSLVLEDARPLIDIGADHQLEPGQPVYSGSQAVGRVVRVGRWTSVLQSVTDPEFRGGLVELARETSLGLVFGPKGLLEGIGDGLCRVNSVSSTEAVFVGQQVYSAARAGDLPGRVYFGRVVPANLSPGSPHWEILVRPQFDFSQLDRVSVLRRVPNPERIATTESKSSEKRR